MRRDARLISVSLHVFASHVFTASRNADDLHVKVLSFVSPPTWAALLYMQSCCHIRCQQGDKSQYRMVCLLHIAESPSTSQSKRESVRKH